MLLGFSEKDGKSFGLIFKKKKIKVEERERAVNNETKMQGSKNKWAWMREFIRE